MNKPIALLLFLLTLPLFSIGQRTIDSYHLHVSTTPMLIENSLDANWSKAKTDSTTLFEGKVHVIVQFNSIPTSEEKETLRLNGLELVSYIPNFAWMSRVDLNLTTTDLHNFNVRNICKVDASWKVPTSMLSGTIPAFAGSAESMLIRVIFWKNTPVDGYNTVLSAARLIDLNETRGIATVECDLNNALLFAEHPQVQFIEFTEPPVENEGLLDESERAISTYISNNPGKNYYFDGTGVKIGVDEGGTVDSLQNPNLRSRLDRSYENGTNVSGHKTGVGLRMASAGNIDPKEQGTAFGAELFSGGLDTYQAASDGITVVNRSYGWGCSNDATTYNSSSETYDNAIRTNPTFMISHSAGNAGGSDCYAGSAGWGNITGLPKMAKNILAVGSSGGNGQLTGFSSRGPAKDGRILPNIVAPGGGGTSHASPNLSGVYAQINHAYRFHNGGAVPNSGLLKAILLNTADDMLNPGPDFKTGYGHVNARRAYDVVRQNQFLTSSTTQGNANVHTISVPAAVQELKVLVYWVDWEATPGIVSRSIVNDLDMVVTDPNSVDYLPWVLNPDFNAITLDDVATRAVDSLNNTEQVTIDNPTPGVYQITVSGSIVPQGPQAYFVTYEFVYDSIYVTHPHGGEQFVPNETERIRWDACDSNLTFNLSYSLDNGNTWNSIASNVAATDRFYDWTVPVAVTNQALIKVDRGQTEGESDANFTVLSQPENLELVWTCADSSLFIWEDFPNADGYVVYRIIGDYMDSVAYASSSSIVLNGLSSTEVEYISVAAVENGVTGRRIVAIEREPSTLNCVQNNLGSLGFIAPTPDFLPSCMAGSNSDLRIQVRNFGVNALPYIPVAYQLNGGTVIRDTIFTSLATGADLELTILPSPSFNLGTNSIDVWTEYPADSDLTNDTLSKIVKVYSSASGTTPLTEDFDSFSTCSTAWDCELVACTMQNGWYNLPNGQGDAIDWRTHTGATGTGGTGPSFDHTSGSGNYLYLESSGPCVFSTARLHSPCFDMTGINTAELSFWYYAFGNSLGELHVDAIVNGELIEDIMIPISGSQADEWVNQTVDLSQFTGQQLVLVIRGSTGGGFYSDLAIDDINILTSPIAQFTSAQTQLCANEVIPLNNQSSNADSYEWSFSPNTVTYMSGTDSSSATPYVSFANAGNYSVQLIATNAFDSDTTFWVDYITVWSGSPTIVTSASYCPSDSIIATTNNNGASVSYFLNGVLQATTTDSIFHYLGAVDGDTLSLTYNINGNCVLSSSNVIVTVNAVDNGAIQNGLQLEATASGAQYQWIDCENNNTIISGATNQVYTPVADGEYAVIVTEGNCSDTSGCLIFSTISLDENQGNYFSVYPNPTSENVRIETALAGSFDVSVFNAIGQRVSQLKFENANNAQFSLDGAPGVYAVVVTTGNGISEVIRIVKK